MPKRTNAFQRLNYLIQKAAQPIGAVVEESRELEDQRTGKMREVDVVIELQSGGVPLRISVECTDRHRKADSGWIEQMKGKHDDLNSGQLILVSKSGFTQPAIEKAKKLGILVSNLDEAETKDWDEFISTWHTTHMTRFLPIPIRCDFQVRNDVVPPEGLPNVTNDDEFLEPSTGYVGNAYSVCEELLKNPQVAEMFFNFFDLDDIPMDESSSVRNLTYKPKAGSLIWRSKVAGIEFEVLQLRITIQLFINKVPVEMIYNSFLGKNVAHAEFECSSQFGDFSGTLVGVEGAKGVLEIADHHGTTEITVDHFGKFENSDTEPED